MRAINTTIPCIIPVFDGAQWSDEVNNEGKYGKILEKTVRSDYRICLLCEFT